MQILLIAGISYKIDIFIGQSAAKSQRTQAHREVLWKVQRLSREGVEQKCSKRRKSYQNEIFSIFNLLYSQ